MIEWFGEFASAIPEAVQALYRFGDPQNLGRGWVGGAIMLLWFGPLLALPLWIAKITYGKHEWVSATMGVFGAASALWWVHGVFPHAWIQFTTSNANVLAGAIIPETFGIEISDTYRLDIASDLYAVITEAVVGALMVGGIVITVWAFLRVQRSLPKTLAAGESKPESGGYK